MEPKSLESAPGILDPRIAIREQAIIVERTCCIVGEAVEAEGRGAGW